jgi:hypothetical protein
MSSRHLAAMAGGVASVLVAAGLAGAVNLGILRSAGSPKGPGRLDTTSVSSVVEGTLPVRTFAPGDPHRSAEAGREVEEADD